MNPIITLASTTEDIKRCYPVMRELRPHLEECEKFIQQVLRQQKTQGYKLVFLKSERDVKFTAGFRAYECLAWGKLLYFKIGIHLSWPPALVF